jgi:putative Mg2+ transporter-C (MgtC) family protein
MEPILIQIIIIFVMSFIFGVQRLISQKPVGFGTFIFVAVGSCVLTSVSGYLVPDNPLVVVGGLITGVGFLGAGALVRTSEKTYGFTTAASIWVFSILGIIIGLEEYLIGGLTYLIIWIVIIVDAWFEKKGIGPNQRKVIIETNKLLEDKNTILKLFGNYKWRLLNIESDKEKNTSQFTYLLTAPRNYVSKLNDVLIKEKWVNSFKIE